MSKKINYILAATLSMAALCLPLLAQETASIHSSATVAALNSNRERDRLVGAVRRVRTETAKTLIKSGQVVEGPRVLRELATYDLKGNKIDDASYAVEGSSTTNKKEYKYDDKGHVIEMISRSDDGSVQSKEVYTYEFDEIGNWITRVASVAVVEGGKLSFEPTEVTYRIITYYYNQSVANAIRTPSPTAATRSPVANLSGGAKPESQPTADNRVDYKLVAEDKKQLEPPLATAPLNHNTNSDSASSSASPGNAKSRGTDLTPIPKTKTEVPSGPASKNNSVPTPPAPAPSAASSTAAAVPAKEASVLPAAKNAAAYYKAGLAHYTAGQHKEAAEAIKQAIQLNPDDAVAYNTLGLTQFALGRYKETVAAFKQAIRLNRAVVPVETFYKLGEACTNLNRNKEAIDAFKQAIYMIRASSETPVEPSLRKQNLAVAHYGLGTAYYNSEQYREAIKAYGQVILLKPDMAEAYFGMGLAYLGVRDRRSAEKQQNILRKLNPTFASRLADAMLSPGNNSRGSLTDYLKRP